MAHDLLREFVLNRSGRAKLRLQTRRHIPPGARWQITVGPQHGRNAAPGQLR